MYYHLIIGVVLLNLVFARNIPQNLNPDANLNIFELAEKYGYTVESHVAKTIDGYILTMHRIPAPSNSTKPPVLLMHGLLSSSVDWINRGPGKALALVLADEGYDVWMGNQRGNTWSRNHTSLDPDKDAAQFFSFSFHEIGVYDLPAKIDYILEKTGYKQIFFVGHSQGTTAFFAMASSKPEYNSKIKLMTALAPVGYMGNMPNPLLRQVAANVDLLILISNIMQIHEFLPHYDFISELGDIICSNSSEYQDLCVWLLNGIAGFDWQVEPDFVSVITSNAPAGSSVNQIFHYFQEVNSERFCQYDYGKDQNLIIYGQEIPPSYNVSKITAPVSLYYSSNDWLSSVDDVQKIKNELSNLVSFNKVPLNQFNHLDFLWAKDIYELLNKNVVEEIKLHS